MSRLPNHTELSWAIRSIQDDSLCNIQHHFLLTANSCSNKDFEFEYSYQELAKIMRRGRSTIIRIVGFLIKKGYLTILTEGNIRKMTPNKFRLNANKILTNIDPILYRKIMTPSPGARLALVPEKSLPSPGARPKASIEAIGAKSAAGAPLCATSKNRDPFFEMTKEEQKEYLIRQFDKPNK